MRTVLTPAEIMAKGITKKDVERLLRNIESRINFYTKQYVKNGYKCSDRIKKAWDSECARWDHMKATLAQWK